MNTDQTEDYSKQAWKIAGESGCNSAEQNTAAHICIKKINCGVEAVDAVRQAVYAARRIKRMRETQALAKIFKQTFGEHA